MGSKLSFVSDEILYREVKRVLDIAQNAEDSAERALYNNIVDPFSAVFDALRQGVSLTEWIEQEKARQIQKTMQNALGTFHQSILGNVDGWEDLGTGSVVDIKNDTVKVIAEVKNKHNTTKGNHKKVIYDDLNSLIASTYRGFTGYYVEIIPKNKQSYNKPFTPPDNETGQRRPENQRIRLIDGKSFYALVTGSDNSLIQLYQALPVVISEILQTSHDIVTSDSMYRTLFEKAYVI